MRWNPNQTEQATGPRSWLPRIANALNELDGAQAGPTPFLDPFARARRNALPQEAGQ